MIKKKAAPFSLPAIDLSCSEGFVRAGLSSKCIEDTFFNRITSNLDTQMTYLLIAIFPIAYFFFWFTIFRHEKGSKFTSILICLTLSTFVFLFFWAIISVINIDYRF
jgi:hypothetical protein